MTYKVLTHGVMAGERYGVQVIAADGESIYRYRFNIQGRALSAQRWSIEVDDFVSLPLDEFPGRLMQAPGIAEATKCFNNVGRGRLQAAMKVAAESRAEARNAKDQAASAMLAALEAIAYHAASQDISHVDFRVKAAAGADEAMAQARAAGITSA